MVALKLLNIKKFMGQLLKAETFDHFLLQEAAVQGAFGCHIDGRLKKDFFTQEETEEGLPADFAEMDFIPYFMVREKCYDLIRGKKTPDSFRFVFLLSPENQKKTIEASGTGFTALDVSAMAFTVRFQNGELTLMTGISYRTFSTDKSLEGCWDDMVKRFLTKNEVEFEELT